MTDGLIALSYAVSLLAAAVLAAMVYRRSPRSRLHRSFVFFTLSLIGWLATLYLFHHAPNPSWLLPLGRLNFACVLPLSLYAYLFVRYLIRRPLDTLQLPVVGTVLLTALTLFTPLIDRAEIPTESGPVTRFGPFFPLYVLHVVGFLGAGLLEAFRARENAPARLSTQLSLLAYGGALFAVLAILTNLLLPYILGNFAFQELGALSTLAFLIPTGYAVLALHLFDIRILIRRTLAIAVLLALIQSGYSRTLAFLTETLSVPIPPTGRFFLGVLTILFGAVTFHYVRPWLEEKLERLFFRRRARTTDRAK